MAYATSGGVADKARLAISAAIDLGFGLAAAITSFLLLSLIGLKPVPRGDKHANPAPSGDNPGDRQ